MNDWDQAIVDSYEDYDGPTQATDERMAYLKFLRDVVFPANPHLVRVTCHKYPEYGTLSVGELESLIDNEGWSPQMLDKLAQEVVEQNMFPEISIPRASDHYQFEYKESKKMKSAEWYRTQAEKMLEQAAKVESVPTEDIFEDGSVITFEKTFGARQGGSTYRYAAIKTELGWSLSGQRNVGKFLTWTEMIEFIGFDGVESIMVRFSAMSLKEYVKAALEVEGLDATSVDDI
jgi:hypothetical protein